MHIGLACALGVDSMLYFKAALRREHYVLQFTEGPPSSLHSIYMRTLDCGTEYVSMYVLCVLWTRCGATPPLTARRLAH